MDMGDLIVFPSILVHEVEEVTDGNRYAFVGGLTAHLGGRIWIGLHRI